MLRLAWHLARPYWSSEERGIAWVLLVTVIGLNLGNVGVSVLINKWYNKFYNALQGYNWHAFLYLLGVFCVLAAASIVMSVYSVYLQQMLQIRWRRWLTGRYLDHWLGDRRYYRLQLDRTVTDNPDQRIADDLRLFVSYVASLALGLLTSAVSVVSFMVILIGLSGPAAIPFGSLGTVYIPAYLAWAALLYAGFGTWLTMKIGHPLVPLNFAQQRFEADFRYSLVRLRENAESVALYGGEPPERTIFDGRFGSVFDNFWRIMKRQKKLNWFTSGYSQLAVIFPVLVVSPRYFAKQIALGGLMQVIDAFGNVQSSLSFIVNSYVDIATWVAVTERLTTFEQRMREIEAGLCAPQPIRLRREGAGVEIRNLDLDLPDGAPLLRGVSLAVPSGGSLLITGPSGCGKSTLLRATAGIWPYGHGEVQLGEGRVFFLPQRPYLPLGTLKDALVYPQSAATAPDDGLAEVLHRVGLGELVPSLVADENWPLRLSLGEQQRVAFARVLLARPDLIFLDEASSALDEPDEARLYRLLRARHPDAAIVSVGHRESLKALHDRVIDLTHFHAGALVAE